MDPSTPLLDNAAGADPNTTESAGGGRLNPTVSTDGDRTNTNNNSNVDDTAASAFATTSGAGDSQTLNIQSLRRNFDFSPEADGADRSAESQNITDDVQESTERKAGRIETEARPPFPISLWQAVIVPLHRGGVT
jgi:hypothetical protein